jgi:membrane-associated protease RseP (regulator of RpoE activity)
MFNGALSLFQITDYVPKYPDHWSCILFTVGLPANLELLLYYIASLSAGLAVLNVVPCFMLDGQGSIL